MNLKLLAGSALALAVLALAAACGGGDGGGDEAGIRIQKGLSVAALGSGADASGGQAEARVAGIGGSGGGAIEAPAPAADIAAFAKGGAAGFGGGFFAFPQQQGQTGITVQGFGSATADADSAILELSFGSQPTGIEPLPVPIPESRSQTEPGSAEGVAPAPPITPGQAQPITEADLQPVIDAIVGQGVARSDIEFIANPYYDPYFSSATLRVTVRNLDAVQGIVDAATAAAGGLTDIALQSTNVSYTVADCAALEKAAMQAAVEDAGDRGTLFAEALGVTRGSVIGASHYTYSFFGPNPCDTSFVGPYPLGGMPYVQGQPGQVQLVANVSITYAIQ